MDDYEPDRHLSGNLSFFALDAYWIGHSDDNGLRILIHMEAQYVRPHIVSHDIKIVFSMCDVSHVQVCRQNTFTREVGTGEHLSKGIDTTPATMPKDGLWFITKGCDVKQPMIDHIGASIGEARSSK